jgi:signal transduction histidine kinase
MLARVNTHFTLARLQKQMSDTNLRLEESIKARTNELLESNAQLKVFIKELTKTSHQLRVNELLFITLFNQSPQVLLLLDSMGNIVQANECAQKALQGSIDTPADPILRGICQCVQSPRDTRLCTACSGEELCKLKSMVSAALECGDTGLNHEIHREIALSGGDTLSKVLVVSVVPIRTRYSCNVLVLVDDITSRKKQEAELVAAKDKAELSDRLKSAFLANISHEIRTPMNAIIGFTNLMVNFETPEEKRKDFGNIVMENGLHLMEIVNDIIDVSKLEAGAMHLNYQDVDVFTIMKSLHTMFKVEAEKINVKLNLNLPDNRQALVVYSDVEKINKVLVVLLDNAFKFTRSGQVELGCSVNGHDLVFHVSDTGIGIDKADFDIIFQPFRQLDISYSRQYGGTGLGLTLAKKIVERLGGRIWVTSEIGQGSCFSFSIPCLTSYDASAPGARLTAHAIQN